MQATGQTRRRPQAAGAADLSDDELAGQRVVFSYAGLQPPPALVRAVSTGQAAGVILFSDNIGSPRQVAAALGVLQRAALASPLHRRLLVLTDQEGGEVRRLPGEPTLSEKEIGESTNPVSLAGAQGAGAALNLRSVGINVNLTPVLDVYRKTGNFIDEYQRSYSSNANVARALGRAFITNQQSRSVAATAKHFPGLGAAATSENTDLKPVTINVPLNKIRSVDEAPFRAAIAAGVKLIMTSWAVYPALDPTRPAGLSPIIIGTELRQRLNFRGVTITDGIDAGAVLPYGSLARRAVLAAQAGADLILAAENNPSQNTTKLGFIAMHALSAALRNGILPRPAFAQSARRVLALRLRP